MREIIRYLYFWIRSQHAVLTMIKATGAFPVNDRTLKAAAVGRPLSRVRLRKDRLGQPMQRLQVIEIEDGRLVQGLTGHANHHREGGMRSTPRSIPAKRRVCITSPHRAGREMQIALVSEGLLAGRPKLTNSR